MYLLRKATAGIAAAAFVLMVASGTAFAAKKAGNYNKLYVPAKIVKGSAVSSGRSFHGSNLPESTLAGIKLGRPAKEVLSKWGNPSRITVGASEVQQPDAQAASATPMPGAYAPMGPNLAAAANMLGLQQPSFGGGLPGLPGMPAPGMPGMPGAAAPAQPSTGSTSAALSEEEVTWTYDLQSGITLEFIITDGLVTQITCGGRGPWGLSKTRTGLQLGDTYKLVLWVCGYPESQKYVGRFLRVSYVNKNRTLFTFLNNKLVGVTVAMVPTELEN